MKQLDSQDIVTVWYASKTPTIEEKGIFIFQIWNNTLIGMENADFTLAYKLFLKYCHNHHTSQKFPLQLLLNTANLRCRHG